MRQGFTLIELSIVLVVIGLVIGGILVGQDLIASAVIRSQITQIEKYQTAKNTFYGKYGSHLPGDIPDPDATSFGFASRGTNPANAGQGNGDGILKGFWNNTAYGFAAGNGECALFWEDLSKAGLIDGQFTTANATSNGNLVATQIPLIMPVAKLGNNNYVYVWSASTAVNANAFPVDNTNYFGVAPVVNASPGGMINNYSPGYVDSGTGLVSQAVPYGMSVVQAYNIDKKMDDGLPKTGNVMTIFLNNSSANWAGTSAISNWSAYGPSAYTCSDNNASASVPWHYSLGAGNNMNCALSFKFQ